MILYSYAKVNLTLKVLDKLPDGYHLLDSLISYIDLYDVIDISENSLGEHKIISNYDVGLEDNLIYRVISKFYEFYNVESISYFTIKHQKNIPMGAGLGGGSSNAAVVLNYLYELYNLNVLLEEKIDFAKDLGADIPFFLTRDSKYISGKGEVLGSSCVFGDVFVLLIKPLRSLSTKSVFSELELENDVKHDYYERFDNIESLFGYVRSVGNDLILAAEKLCPEVREILDIRSNKIEFVSNMSGSGSTCFFLFKTEKDCLEMERELKQKFPDYFIYKTSLLSQPR